MPHKELRQLQAIHRFLSLDIDRGTELQEITVLVSELLDCPIAMITIMGENVQRVLHKVGVKKTQFAREQTFCKDLTTEEPLLVIEDTFQDEKLIGHAFLKRKPPIRFYAGALLKTHDGHELGSLCVMDTKPKKIKNAQVHLLKVLAKRVIQIMEFEFSINLLKEQFIKSRESEIKLRSFFETSSALHMLIGRDRQVLDFNKNMAEFLDRMHGVIVKPGMKVDEILHDQHLEKFIIDFEAALQLQGRTVKFEREVIYGNGEKYWWMVTFEPGFNPEGDIIGISYNATDITDRKAAEAVILAQNESLKEIAFAQSHKLRKPVATILGLIEVLQQLHADSITDEITMLKQVSTELDQVVKDMIGRINSEGFLNP